MNARAHAWYCEADAGRSTHVAESDLVLDAEDCGEPDAKGGFRLRRSGGDRSLVACRCGSMLRRRRVAEVAA